MEEFFNSLFQIIHSEKAFLIYLFLFASAVIENLFPPIPGDTIVAFGAFLVGTGRLDYFLVYLSTTAGSVLGFMCLFGLGRILQREFFLERDYAFFSAKNIVSAENWFRKWGYYVVVLNRFFPGIRSVISIVSGISQLHPLKVLGLSCISAAIWNAIWIQAGYMLGTNWDAARHKVTELLKTYNLVAGALIAMVVIGFVVYFVRKKKVSGTN